MTTDRGLFIGRFQPFHKGHLAVVERLAAQHDEVVLALGSANVSHTLINPFTAGERIEMIVAALKEAGLTNVIVVPIPDLGRNPLWVAHVTSLVPRFSTVYTNNPLPTRLFAEAGFKTAPAPFVQRESFEGTRLRALMVEGGDWRAFVPPAVARVIDGMDVLSRVRDLQVSDGVVEGRESGV